MTPYMFVLHKLSFHCMYKKRRIKALGLPGLTMFILPLPGLFPGERQTCADKPYLTFPGYSQVPTMSGRGSVQMLCPRPPNPGQVGFELTGILCQCASPSNGEARCVRWCHSSRPASHPLPGIPELCPPHPQAPLLPGKAAAAGELRALSSLRAGQSFKGPHPK